MSTAVRGAETLETHQALQPIFHPRHLPTPQPLQAGSPGCGPGQPLGLSGESLQQTSGGHGCGKWQGQRREGRGHEGPRFLPFIVTELVAVVIRRDDVNQQDILGLGVHACDFDLVAGEHPPGGSQRVRWRQGQSTSRDGTAGVRGQTALRAGARPLQQQVSASVRTLCDSRPSPASASPPQGEGGTSLSLSPCSCQSVCLGGGFTWFPKLNPPPRPHPLRFRPSDFQQLKLRDPGQDPER